MQIIIKVVLVLVIIYGFSDWAVPIEIEEYLEKRGKFGFIEYHVAYVVLPVLICGIFRGWVFGRNSKISNLIFRFLITFSFVLQIFVSSSYWFFYFYDSRILNFIELQNTDIEISLCTKILRFLVPFVAISFEMVYVGLYIERYIHIVIAIFYSNYILTAKAIQIQLKKWSFWIFDECSNSKKLFIFCSMPVISFLIFEYLIFVTMKLESQSKVCNRSKSHLGIVY